MEVQKKKKRIKWNRYVREGDIIYVLDDDGYEITKTDFYFYPLIWRFKWSIGPQGYPIAARKGKQIKMHRLLTGFHEELVVDHIDRDKTNNLILNLRLVTPKENSENRNAKGCYYQKSSGKWMAYIGSDYKLKNLGLYDTEAEAHLTYLIFKLRYHKSSPTDRLLEALLQRDKEKVKPITL